MCCQCVRNMCSCVYGAIMCLVRTVFKGCYYFFVIVFTLGALSAVLQKLTGFDLAEFRNSLEKEMGGGGGAECPDFLDFREYKKSWAHKASRRLAKNCKDKAGASVWETTCTTDLDYPFFTDAFSPGTLITELSKMNKNGFYGCSTERALEVWSDKVNQVGTIEISGKLVSGPNDRDRPRIRIGIGSVISGPKESEWFSFEDCCVGPSKSRSSCVPLHQCSQTEFRIEIDTTSGVSRIWTSKNHHHDLPKIKSGFDWNFSPRIFVQSYSDSHSSGASKSRVADFTVQLLPTKEAAEIDEFVRVMEAKGAVMARAGADYRCGVGNARCGSSCSGTCNGFCMCFPVGYEGQGGSFVEGPVCVYQGCTGNPVDAPKANQPAHVKSYIAYAEREEV